MTMAEKAAMVCAFVAGARRLVPKLDGWAVVALVAVASVALSVEAAESASDLAQLSGALFVASYGGWNGLRKLLEAAGKGAPTGPEGASK